MLALLAAALFNAAPTRAALAVHVEIAGVTGALLNNVRAYLSIEQQKADPALTETQLQRLHQRAAEEITKALQPFGYYNPQIHSSLRFADGTWLAHSTSIPARRYMSPPWTFRCKEPAPRTPNSSP